MLNVWPLTWKSKSRACVSPWVIACSNGDLSHTLISFNPPGSPKYQCHMYKLSSEATSSAIDGSLLRPVYCPCSADGHILILLLVLLLIYLVHRWQEDGCWMLSGFSSSAWNTAAPGTQIYENHRGRNSGPFWPKNLSLTVASSLRPVPYYNLPRLFFLRLLYWFWPSVCARPGLSILHFFFAYLSTTGAPLRTTFLQLF